MEKHKTTSGLSLRRSASGFVLGATIAIGWVYALQKNTADKAITVLDPNTGLTTSCAVVKLSGGQADAMVDILAKVKPIDGRNFLAKFWARVDSIGRK